MRKKYKSSSSEDTLKIAKEFARGLKGNELIYLKGELGAGKTVFIKGIASYFGIDKNEVNSPTFTLMNVYEGKIPIFHLDLYRLSPEEAEEMISDFVGKGLIILEWGDRLKEDIFDLPAFFIEIKVLEEDKREIIIEKIEDK